MGALARGTTVRTLVTTKIRRRAADFPGWGAPNCHDFLLDPRPGLFGTVTHVEYHGSSPWTRYSVRFADGTSASGLELGVDISIARA